MTDEERDEILNQAFRNISVEREANQEHVTDLKEDPLELWEKNMPKPEPAPPQRKLDTRRGPTTTIYEWVEQRLEAERQFVLEVAGQAIGELLDEQHKAAKNSLQDEVRSLRLELTQLELALTELRTVLAKERGLASALPQSMRTVN